jgi:hypothetical protein
MANAKRAANRARSKSRAGGSMDTMRYQTGEEHSSMHGRRIPHREPEHHEEGGNHRHEAHASWRSPASAGASKGPGPLPGAGELPGRGPGESAKGDRGIDPGITPMDAAPAPSAPGMKTYNQE